MTRLITYVSTIDSAKLAINHGATDLIIDDPRLSIRSFQSQGINLVELIQDIQSAFPTIQLSVNCDMMVHDCHVSLLEQFVNELKLTSVRSIRIQDVGLISFFKDRLPNCLLTLNMEIGNHNHRSIDHHNSLVNGQVLSNELTYSELRSIVSHIPNEYELQVHGPILLQYSYRRYLASILFKKNPSNESVDSYPMIADKVIEDADYKGRFFPVLDNHHGHFMYFFMDRCLIKHAEKLLDLDLGGWIIDGRGHTQSYLKWSLQAYKQLLDGYDNSDRLFDKLAQISPRPLKPGFFVANKTDQRRQSIIDLVPDNFRFVGRVLDVIPTSFITIEVISSFSRDFSNEPGFITPDRKIRFYSACPSLSDLNGRPITSLTSGMIVQLPWLKGVVSNSLFIV